MELYPSTTELSNVTTPVDAAIAILTLVAGLGPCNEHDEMTDLVAAVWHVVETENMEVSWKFGEEEVAA